MLAGVVAAVLLVSGCGQEGAPLPGGEERLQGTYESIGQGMGETLTLASEKQAYTLSDRGTFIFRRSGLGLVVLVEGDPLLRNPYGVIAVNPEKHPSVSFGPAQDFISYLTSYTTQQMIADFKVNGEQLFYPDSEEWRSGSPGSSLPGTPPSQSQRLVLATTTSTADSGLLGHILPPFQRAYNTEVLVVAVGTGQAIALGRNGDADVILVHAREQEDAFLSEGYGVNRRDVMYNDFVVLGPRDDPAGIGGMKDAGAAFEKLARSGVTFISRGDKSGTHISEMEVWARAGIEPLPAERGYRWLD